MSQKQLARSWACSVVGKHLPRNVSRFNLCSYVGEQNVNSTLGLPFDLQPFTGKVVEVTEQYVLVKAGRKAEFFVGLCELLDTVPPVGSEVRITTYARRRFDGERLDAPVKSVDESGIVFSTFMIGGTVSRIPIDREKLKCQYLADMMTQLEEITAPDGVRKIAQVLIDAGAWTEPVAFVDPDDDRIIETPPALKFAVRNSRHVGHIEYRYDRAMDAYGMRLFALDGEVVECIDDVYFDDLGRITADWIDEGTWRIAKVVILDGAPRAAEAA